MAASQGQVQVYELSAWGVWLSSGHLLCHPEHGLSEEAPAVAGTGPVGGSWTVRWDGSHRRAAHPRECLGSDVRNAVGSVLGRLEGRKTASCFPKREQGRSQSHPWAPQVGALGQCRAWGLGQCLSGLPVLWDWCQWEGLRDLGGG